MSTLTSTSTFPICQTSLLRFTGARCFQRRVHRPTRIGGTEPTDEHRGTTHDTCLRGLSISLLKHTGVTQHANRTTASALRPATQRTALCAMEMASRNPRQWA